jgi:hypothetical protein
MAACKSATPPAEENLPTAEMAATVWARVRRAVRTRRDSQAHTRVLGGGRESRSRMKLNESSWTPATEEEIAAVLAENGVSSLDEVPEGTLVFHGWQEWIDHLLGALPEPALTPEVREALRDLLSSRHDETD